MDFQVELQPLEGGKPIMTENKVRLVYHDSTKMPKGLEVTLFKKGAYTHFQDIQDIVFKFSMDASPARIELILILILGSYSVFWRF